MQVLRAPKCNASKIGLIHFLQPCIFSHIPTTFHQTHQMKSLRVILQSSGQLALYV